MPACDDLTTARDAFYHAAMAERDLVALADGYGGAGAGDLAAALRVVIDRLGALIKLLEADPKGPHAG